MVGAVGWWCLVLLVAVTPASAQMSLRTGEDGWTSFLQAEKVTVLSVEVDGAVAAINAEPQDFVQAGAVLVQLDDSLARLQLESIETEINLSTAKEAAQIRFDYARDSLEIVTQLYEEKVEGTPVASEREVKVAQQERDMARLEIKKAELDMALLELRARQTAKLIEKHAVRAPMDGVLVPFSSVQRYEEIKEVEVGEVVRAGQQVAALLKVDRLRVAEPLPAAWFDRVKLGQDVPVHVQGVDDPLTGTLVYKSPTIGSTGEFDIEVEVVNPLRSGAASWPRNRYRYALRPGMRARVELNISEAN